MTIFNEIKIGIKQAIIHEENLENKIQINIPEKANELIFALQDHGHDASVVGGCVRDSILGKIPHDWDICTSATPTEMLEIFKNKKIIETGLKHGTITVVMDDEQYEITTYRIDGEYSDNRRPDAVLFTNELTEDLKRRDFTINAIAYNDTEGLIDPFGGLNDIRERKIRCVGSAKNRFEEDALRILRAIRFSAQLDFDIDSETAEEIRKQHTRLGNISVERICSEFRKIVISPRFPSLLSIFPSVFSFIIPDLASTIGFQQNNPYHAYDVFEHTIHALENCHSDDPIVKLAVFFHDFGKPYSYQDSEDGYRHFHDHGNVSAIFTDRIMEDLKFDSETRINVVQLVRHHDATFEVSKKCVKRWLNKIGEIQFRRLLEVRKADIKGQSLNYNPARIQKVENIEKVLKEILEEKECFSLKDLAINGKDLIEAGFKEGKGIGIILNFLLHQVMDGEIENKKEVLLGKARKVKEKTHE